MPHLSIGAGKEWCSPFAILRECAFGVVGLVKGIRPFSHLHVAPLRHDNCRGGHSAIFNLHDKAISLGFWIRSRDCLIDCNKSALFRNIGMQGASSAISRFGSLSPSSPNKINAYTTERHTDDRHNAHYSRPEGHRLLTIQIILVTLIFAGGVAAFLRALFVQMGTKTFFGYLIVGISGISGGMAGCFAVIPEVLDAQYTNYSDRQQDGEAKPEP